MTQETPRGGWANSWWAKTLAIGVFLCAIVFCVAEPFIIDRDPPSRHSPGDAYAVAQDYVSRELRAPLTARFPCCSEDFTTSLGYGRYEVVSYVDAENAFGAMIREPYIAVVRWNTNDSWALESLIFESDF